MVSKIVSGIMLTILLTGIIAFNIRGAESLPATEWDRTYGGAGLDEARSVIQTADGGYALAGWTKSFGNDGDFLLVKADTSGNMQWIKPYNGPWRGWSSGAYSVIQTTDGGYTLVGPGFVLIKTDSEGNEQWRRAYGEYSDDKCAFSLVLSSDGGYVLAGCFWSSVYFAYFLHVVKTDLFGNVQWENTYGNTAGISSQRCQIIRANDGGYAVISSRWISLHGWDVFLARIDANGDLQWSKTYGGTNFDEGFSIVQTLDGGYALAGYTNATVSGDYDFLLIKTDNFGNMQWQNKYGGVGNDFGFSVIQTVEGGCMLAGETDSIGAGGMDFWLAKTDANGNLQWSKTYGGTDWDGAASVIQTVDGGYALAGVTNSYGVGGGDVWLVKTTKEMRSLTITATAGGTTNPSPRLYSVPLGSECPIEVIPSVNYMFDHWELDGDNIGSSNPTTVTMDTNHDIRAFFTIVSPPTYDVTMKAHCNTEGSDVTVSIWIDELPAIYYTPYTFTGLTGVHKFTASIYDTSSHSFKQWSTGVTSNEISTSNGGVFIAYYETPSPQAYDADIIAICKTEKKQVHVSISMDQEPSGYTTYHKFTSLTGSHTFTVPAIDPSGHPFAAWDSGDTDPTISVMSGGMHIAYYSENNLKPLYIEAVQSVRTLTCGGDLVKDKPATFIIGYTSTFLEEQTCYVRVDLEGFDYNEWTFRVTLKPGNNEFWVHSVDKKCPVIKPTSSSNAECKVTLDVFNEITESNEGDNTYPASGTEQYHVHDTKGLKVLFVRLHHANEPTDSRISYAKAYRYMTAAFGFFTATYPVDPNEIFFTLDPEAILVPDGKNYNWILDKLTSLASTEYTKVVGVAGDTWNGWRDDDLFGDAIGFSNMAHPRAVAVTNYTDVNGYLHIETVAHELGHKYDLGDDYSGVGATLGKGTIIDARGSGYWVAKGTSMNNMLTFMNDGGHGPPDAYWVDSTDYSILLGKFQTSDPEVLLVSGTVWKNGSAALGANLYRIPDNLVDFEGSTGNYYVVLLDGGGNVLSRTGFNVTFTRIWPQQEVNEEGFGFTVMWISGTEVIQIQDAQGNVLDSRIVSQNSPSVHVVSPNGNETITPGNSYTIEWSAADLDGDPLTYTVLISSGAGSTPVPIAIGLNQTTFVYDFTDIQEGDQYSIHVLANDGVNVAVDLSDGFFSVSGFKIDVLTAPQTIGNRAKTYYWLNLTSCEGFAGKVTLEGSSNSENLTMRWLLGPTIIIPRNGSSIAIIEVEAADAEGGNHTIIISGASGNCTAEAITYICTTSNDISVSDTASSRSITGQGYSLTINVTVYNHGSFGENFNLTLYGNSIEITRESIFLYAGSSTTITLTWNTSGFSKGNYTISAYATPVPGETNAADNNLTGGWIIVALVGDISGPTVGVPDGKCDVRDLAAIAKHYGHDPPYSHAPGTPEYTMCFNVDMTGPTTGVPDGKVDIRDLAAAAKNFGRIDP